MGGLKCPKPAFLLPFQVFVTIPPGNQPILWEDILLRLLSYLSGHTDTSAILQKLK